MGFNGNTLHYQYYYYAAASDPKYGNALDLTVNGVSQFDALNAKGTSLFAVTVTDTAIGFSFDNTALWHAGYKDPWTGNVVPVSFSGPVFEDKAQKLAPIIGVSFKTNITAIHTSDVKFDADRISVDFRGATTYDSSYLVLHVVFQAQPHGPIVFYAKAEAASVRGQGANDKFYGSKFADIFEGGAGNDTLTGHGGADVLDGGVGNDDLYGGSGRDIFVFRSTKDFGQTKTATDTIFDFTTEDKIDLAAIDANTKSAGGQAFTFIGTKAFTGKAGELRYEKAVSDTYIYGDVNGDRKFDFVLHLDDAFSLQKEYFLL